MNVKTTISLPEDLMRYAEKMVEDGQFPSVDTVLAASLENMMIRQDQAAVDEVLHLNADALRRRLDTPIEETIAMDEDDLFDRVRARIAAPERQ
ncbi:antitoxin ParD1/3/4 [Rhizobium sp. PP-CC-3A-592]|nr:antitoxin ParD1/3/4 [Rhizobium sp. PP-CC-3A-592]